MHLPAITESALSLGVGMVALVWLGYALMVCYLMGYRRSTASDCIAVAIFLAAMAYVMFVLVAGVAPVAQGSWRAA